MNRRLFLGGLGGVTLGLPVLEGILGSEALAQSARTPFVAIIVCGNGVIQPNNAGDPDLFWPTKTGALTQAALTADKATRAIGELSGYAERLLVVRGLNHGQGANGCNHASANAQCLTGAGLVGSGSSQTAGAASVDTTIALAMNRAGVEPLFLHAGRYSAGGTGYNVPSYVSYVSSGKQRAGIASPLKAYQRLVGTTGAAGTPGADATALRRKSVNDVLRTQIQALQKRTELTSADRSRLDQHFTAIRDIEVKIATALSAEKVTAMTAVDPKPYDMLNHEVIQRLHMDLMVFALSSDHTKVAVLQVGDREDDHEYTVNGVKFHFHNASHRSVPNGLNLCAAVDRIQANHFKYLLDQLNGITTPTGTFLDEGVAVWTNQLGTGPDHSHNNLPWVLAGTAKGYLKKGQFVSLPSTRVNVMLNTLAAAAGVMDPRTGGTAGVLTQIVA